ncbi:MAG TPA: DUF308 domain-containing protein [Actinomycetota bacterium]|nr:DUF308 domain-containing protein [Actinomycetota bacterium]
MASEQVRDDARESRAMISAFPWWLFLLTGIAWMLIAIVVLRYNVHPTTSVATVGILVGALFLAACINEFAMIGRAEGWKWLHALLGVVFGIAALWGFFRPINTFFALASVIGFLFVFWGTMLIVENVMTREVNPMWGLGLATGILVVLLGFWAAQQFYPARAELILLWVGFMALFRGIGQLVLAFSIHHAQKELA